MFAVVPGWRKSSKARQRRGMSLHSLSPRIPSGEGVQGMADDDDDDDDDDVVVVVVGGGDPSRCACQIGQGGLWSSMYVGCGAGG